MNPPNLLAGLPLAALLALLAVPLGWYAPAAAAATPGPKEGWGGEAELGVVATSGNTNTRSLNGKAAFHWRHGPWQQGFHLEALKASDEGGTTAERYAGGARTDYQYDKRGYLFATFRYEDDRFSGYEYQYSEVVGAGHRLVDTTALSLDLEAGVGARHSRPKGEEREDEAILRGAGKLLWQISESARFRQELSLESGRKNTYTESVSALRLKVNSHLAMKWSLSVRRNSEVPPETRHTDTTSAVTLVYDF